MEREITSLALIKATYAQFEFKRDYIENFLPFIANLIRKRNINRVNLSELNDFLDVFHDEFGLKIPFHPMLTILERCRKRGLFTREYNQLIPILEKIQECDFGDMAVEKETKINELLQDIVDYGKEQFSINISKEEAQNILLGYLSSHDMDIIFASYGDVILPNLKVAPNLRYLFANYVAHVKDSNSVMFNLIIEVAVGHILANTILYADKLLKYTGKFKGLHFYLDVRFIFRLLGYEGDLFRTAYIELLKAIKEQEACLCIFNHTFEEVTGVLNGAVRWADSPEYDPSQASPVSKYYRNAGKNKADIQHDLATIDNRIKDFEIHVVSSPEFIKSKDKQIDEIKLQECINQVYSDRNIDFDPIEKKTTIEKDVKSIAAVSHLRTSFSPVTLKQAQHFFITSNSGLAYASRRYEIEQAEGEKFIPLCLTDVFVGTLVWLQSPVRWIDINQKKFLADCMALLNPSAVFIKRLIDEAKKLKEMGRLNDDEYLIVRSSIYVQQELMKEVCGDPESINTESIEDVIGRIRSEAQAPLEEKIRHKDSEIIGLQQKNIETARKEQKYRLKLDNIAAADAKKFTRFILCGLWTVFIFTLTVSFIDWVIWFKKVLQILSACFAVVGFGFGCNIKNIRETVFSKRLIKVRRKYGIGDTP